MDRVMLGRGQSVKRRLLDLPRRDLYDAGWWDFLVFVPTNKRHDSGYGELAVIGCVYDRAEGDRAVAILDYTDVIYMPDWCGYRGKRMDDSHTWPDVRIDAYMPGGIMRVFASDWDFSFHLTDIRLRETQRRKR